ncbi:MAG TPA: DUF4386 domain-containing protein [Thermoanaerobaculia bacterium]
MGSIKKDARFAGLMYLLLMTAPLRLVYIPNALLVRGNAAATAHNIATHETLFRLGIVSDLFTGTAAIFLLLALYRLFKGVDQGKAVLMVILGCLVSTPIYFLNTLNDVAALLLAKGSDFLAAFSRPQQEAMVMLFLQLHKHGVLANEIFWGLWLLPFGALVFRSGFLPRFLGVWLIVGGLGYVAISLTGFLVPQYEDLVARIAFPGMLGELAILLWLLIRGAKEPAPLAAAA